MPNFREEWHFIDARFEHNYVVKLYYEMILHVISI